MVLTTLICWSKIQFKYNLTQTRQFLTYEMQLNQRPSHNNLDFDIVEARRMQCVVQLFVSHLPVSSFINNMVI